MHCCGITQQLLLLLLAAAARAADDHDDHDDHDDDHADHEDHDHGDHADHGGADGDSLSDSEVWGATMVSILVISLMSLVGIALLARHKRGQPLRVPPWLLAFAAGTLLGDSIVHLFPGLFSLLQLDGKFVVHAHGVAAEDHVDHDAEEGSDDQTMTGVLVYICMLVFVLFCVDFAICRYLGGHSHAHGDEQEKDNKIIPMGLHHHADPPQDPDAAAANENKEAESNAAKDVGEAEKPAKRQIKSFAVVNLVGDFFHNIVDGLAIGIAFSLGWSDGISASIAILVHEVAQELGDFSVLIRGGFSIRQALIINLLTAMSAFIGGIAGAAAGTSAGEDNYWLTATVIASFMYIALVSLLPMLMHELRSVFDIAGAAIGFTTAIGMMWALTEIEKELEE